MASWALMVVVALVAVHEATAGRDMPAGDKGLADQKNYMTYNGVGSYYGIGDNGIPFGGVGGGVGTNGIPGIPGGVGAGGIIGTTPNGGIAGVGGVIPGGVSSFGGAGGGGGLGGLGGLGGGVGGLGGLGGGVGGFGGLGGGAGGGTGILPNP